MEARKEQGNKDLFVGKNIKVFYTDNLGVARVKEGMVVSWDSNFLNIKIKSDGTSKIEGIKNSSIDRYEVKNG